MDYVGKWYKARILDCRLSKSNLIFLKYKKLKDFKKSLKFPNFFVLFKILFINPYFRL